LRSIVVLLSLLLHQLMHVSERTFEGQPDKLASFSDTRPGEQTLQYVLNGTLRDAHAFGDVPIRETAKDAQERPLLADFQCAAGLLISTSRLVEALIGQELDNLLIDPNCPTRNDPDRLY